MVLISTLREALAIARELKESLPEIRAELKETLGLARELRTRMGRDAQKGDLQDSLARLDALDRTKDK